MTSFTTSLQYLILTIFLSAILRLLRIYVRHSHIPGPLPAKVTSLYLWYHHNHPPLFRGPKLTALHAKYGPIVLISPNKLSIADPRAIPILYGTNPVWRKGPSYDVIVGVNGKTGRLVNSLISMDERMHSRVLKGVGLAFTANAVLDFERFVDLASAELLEQLRGKHLVDIGWWCQLFAMDVLNRVTFGSSPGFLGKAEDVGGMLATVEQRFEYWNMWEAMPGLEYWVHKNPALRKLGIGKTPVNTLARVAGDEFRKRREEEGRFKGGETEHKDLLQKYLDGQAKYPSEISDTNVMGLIVSSIAAGADTTATTLTSIFYFLMKSPRVLAQLEREIETALREGRLSQSPRWAEVHNLPYLDAVIKETMRYFSIIAFGLDRVVPAGGKAIAGVFIPGGTVVSCHNESIHLDKGVYGHDADVYRPERWLEADDEWQKKMERTHLGFGVGKRICPGRHIAMLEMKKVIPLLLMNFDMKLQDSSLDIRDILKINAVKYTKPVMATIVGRKLDGEA